MDSFAYTQLHLAYEAEEAPEVLLDLNFKPSLLSLAPIALAFALVMSSPEEAKAYYTCDCYWEPDYVEYDYGYAYGYPYNGDVAAIQYDLKDLGYFPYYVKSTGYYGPITTDSVKAFQYDHGLAVDGIAGPHTQATLASHYYY